MSVESPPARGTNSAATTAHAPRPAKAPPMGRPVTPFGDVLSKRRASLVGSPSDRASLAEAKTAQPTARATIPKHDGLPSLMGKGADAASRAVDRMHEREHGRPRKDTRGDALDPNERHAAQLGPPPMLEAPLPPAPVQVAEAAHRASLESMLPRLVKSIAYVKENARKGSMLLEFGAGSLKGCSMAVHADHGQIVVRLEVPAGQDAEAWRSRIHEALLRRGVEDADVQVS
jgi:hypothetical protein